MTADAIMLWAAAILAGVLAAGWLVLRRRATRADTEATRQAGGPLAGLLHDPRARLIATTTHGPIRWRVRGTLVLGATRLVYQPIGRRHALTLPRTSITHATVTRELLGRHHPQALLQVIWTDPADDHDHTAGWIVNDPARWAAALSTKA